MILKHMSGASHWSRRARWVNQSFDEFILWRHYWGRVYSRRWSLLGKYNSRGVSSRATLCPLSPFSAPRPPCGKLFCQPCLLCHDRLDLLKGPKAKPKPFPSFLELLLLNSLSQGWNKLTNSGTYTKKSKHWIRHKALSVHKCILGNQFSPQLLETAGASCLERCC